ncbi:hypothetical protein MFERI15568_00711 [Mycoplasma feriruminatoris]|uniref:Uncharacterized protein n=1 Tax=Mycoplasma feriruminatoris TaxID=1179777 RepID=A0AAQ3DSV4_9MOLU|nr:hypothetical protein [Mycoplasma feriruminatoris]WFQ93789.1 hypothetical protein MFERI15181_00710 [Mycoplasma feriruminatoris]WFQ95449.1 hypothetical protein MFERI15407_00710 [Mycoplasma feriruminatoris]WFQ96274.1 hypothetical protein MFERI15568_00711 [Mycoplasma feriruminatoris]
MLLMLVVKTELIVNLGVLGFGLLFVLIGLFLYWKQKNNNRYSFEKQNRESKNAWEFTKKNFYLLVLAIGFLFIITAIITLITK